MAQESINNNKNQQTRRSGRFSAVIAALNEKKMLILGMIAVAAFFSLLLVSLYDQSYTASILIYPDQLTGTGLIPGNGHSSAMSNASGYGLPIETYPALLRSPEIQMQVLQKSYSVRFKYKSYTIDLVKYFALKNISYAFGKLNNITKIDFLDNSHILKLSVTTKYPELSRQVAEAYLDGLEKHLEQLRQEKLSEDIDQLDQALQFIETSQSITDSAREDIIGRLQNKKEMFLLAGNLNPVKLGMLREGYTHKNGLFSRTTLAVLPLILGFGSIAIILGTAIRSIPQKPEVVPVKSGRISLKRKSETNTSQGMKKSRTSKPRKTTAGKKPQRRRAVKV